MYVTYTRIYGWSDYGGESSYQPGYRLENMMWMTLLVYDYIIPVYKVQDSLSDQLNFINKCEELEENTEVLREKRYENKKRICIA